MAHTGSREMFRLSVLVIALGTAFGAAELFGVSFALGAFFAGMILSESKLSQQAADRNPAAARRLRRAVLRLGGHAVRSRAFSCASRCRCSQRCSSSSRQVAGRFRHRARLRLCECDRAHDLGLRWRRSESSPSSSPISASTWRCCPEQGRDLILAGAIISIILNPFLFSALDWLSARQEGPARRRHKRGGRSASAHAGRRGRGRPARGSEAYRPQEPCGVDRPWPGRPGDQRRLERAEGAALRHRRRRGGGRGTQRSRASRHLAGNAAEPDVMAAANLPAASCLLVAIADGSRRSRWWSRPAPSIPPSPSSPARIRGGDGNLKQHGATVVVMGEHEIAKSMLGEVAARGHASG